jgi:hydroxyacylglutathione hydrolase
LPDYLQIWPAHGAGSACGKGLGAIPSSTVGYEKLFNPALQFTDEDEFVSYILADQPEAPKYFAVMKRVNKEGPAVLGPDDSIARLDASELPEALKRGALVDLAPATEFARAHVPGTWNIPVGMLAGWAGWLLDYTKPVYLISAPDQLAEAVRVLRKIGVENIAGEFDSESVRASGHADQTYPSITAQELALELAAGDVHLIDVRTSQEWAGGHIAGATHHFLGKLRQELDLLETDKAVAVQCQAGARSAIAASILQAAGIPVVNVEGGYQAWVAAELPVVRSSQSKSLAATA